jgi:hypothetical protein
MRLDFWLTLLNVVFGLGIALIGVEMVNNPPTSSRLKWIYRTLFIVLGVAVVITTAFQSARSSEEQARTKTEADKTERELSNKVSEQGGKLDAITHFEQQFLTFVSQRPGSTAGSSTRMDEAMALAVIKMAQGYGVNSQPKNSLRARALDLAEELDVWSAQREADMPSFPNFTASMTQEQRQVAMAPQWEYRAKTPLLWKDKFSSRLDKMALEFRDKGISPESIVKCLPYGVCDPPLALSLRNLAFGLDEPAKR